MSWWQARQARKRLVKSGFDEDSLKQMEAHLKLGYETANQYRKEQQAFEPKKAQLVGTLNSIKSGTASIETKARLSEQLIQTSDLPDQEKHDLLEQLQKVYNSPSND